VIAHIGGRSIAYDDTGPAEHDSAVVFLHGFPHHRAFWAPQLAELGGRYRCIAPDLRGFGETPPAAPHSMDRYADDVVELLDALGVARAAVVGLSMGGYVAFALWRRHQERVAALVLADTRAGADSEEARGKRRALMRLARTAGSDAVADSQLPGSIGRTTRDEEPERVSALRELLAAAPVEGIVGALEAMLARPDSTATLETIDVPTLVVVGRDDAITRPAESRAMHARIPGSRLVVVKEAGHLSSFEQPAAFNLALGEFLAAVPAVRPTIGGPP
jgi:3-oxoadipate enol-lactonase